MRCLIIHNPASGPRSDEIFDFARALSEAGDEVCLRFIGDGMEPHQAAEDVSAFDRVVVSGGDGTVSNVLDHIRDSHVPTLVFPSGTANLFFNNIGNAPEPAALAKACREGRTKTADMGELFWKAEDGSVQRHGFIIIAGTGFDADIMHKAEPAKGDMGEIAYFLSALANPAPTVAHFTIEHDGIAGTGFDADIMHKAEPAKGDMGEIAYFLSALANPAPTVAHFTIEHDGKVDELDGIGCMVGNTSLIQNDINLFPDCRMDDGFIDIAVIQPAKTVELLPTDIAVIQPAKTVELLPTLLAGVLDPAGKGLGRPQFTLFQAKEARITCTPSLGMEFDGELIHNNTGEFGARVLPACLDLIVDDFAKL